MSGTRVQRPEFLSPEELDRRLANGWYRIGQTLMTCKYVLFNGVLRTAIWTRLPLEGHRFKRSHRKLISRADHHYRITSGPMVLDARHERLYQRYRAIVRGERAASLHEFLYGDGVDSVFDTRELSLWDGDRLAAFSWFDLGRSTAQSLIGVYDPDHARHSLGFTTMLLEMREAMDRGIAYYYPGYVLPGEAAMDYKLRLPRLEVRHPGTGRWLPAAALDGIPLPTELLWRGLRRAKRELGLRGVHSQLRLYRMFEVGAYNPALSRCLTHPLVLECLGGARRGSVLLVLHDTERQTFELVRCQRAVAQIREHTEVGETTSRVGLLLVEERLAQGTSPAAIADMVATRAAV